MDCNWELIQKPTVSEPSLIRNLRLHPEFNGMLSPTSPIHQVCSTTMVSVVSMSMMSVVSMMSMVSMLYHVFRNMPMMMLDVSM